jgi:hypothetical protein
MAVFLLVAFVAFFVTSPYLVLHIPEFLHKIYHEFSHEQQIVLVNTILNNKFIAPFILIFPAMLSITVYVLSMSGIYIYSKNNKFYDIVFFFIYPFVYIITINVVSNRPSYIFFSYFYLTVMPFFILLAAYSFVYMWDKIRKRWFKVLIAIIVFIDILSASWNFTSGSYTYNRVGDWITKNIPPNSSLLILNSFRPILNRKYYVYPIYTETIQKTLPIKYIIKTFNPDFVIATRLDVTLLGGYDYFNNIMEDEHFHRVRIFTQKYTPYVYLFSPLIHDIDNGTIYIYKNH